MSGRCGNPCGHSVRVSTAEVERGRLGNSAFNLGECAGGLSQESRAAIADGVTPNPWDAGAEPALGPTNLALAWIIARGGAATFRLGFTKGRADCCTAGGTEIEREGASDDDSLS